MKSFIEGRVGRWRHWPLRGKGLVVIVVPCAALVVGTLSGVLAERRQVKAREWAQHTQQVRLEIGALFNALFEAEGAARAALLAGMPGARERFRELDQQVPEQLRRLQESVSSETRANGRSQR